MVSFLVSVAFLLAICETLQAAPIQQSDAEYDRSLKTFPLQSVYQLNRTDAPSLELTDKIYNQWLQPIVIEEYNLIFFRVAKCASSEWTRLLMRLENNEKWCGYKDVHPPEVNRFKRLSDYPIEVAREMMTNPKWTKAIFVRNPKKRILSAFVDKSITHPSVFKKRYCGSYAMRMGQIMGRPKGKKHSKSYTTCQDMHKSFKYFLYNFTTVLDDDAHWRSCYSFVDRKWWPYINHIANMEDLSKDAEDLLKSLKSNVDGVSAWDRVGKTGWHGHESTICLEGNGAFLRTKQQTHATNSSDMILTYYTPELESYIEKRYVDDYNNPFFRFKRMKLFREGNKDVDEEEVYEDQ